MNTNHEETGVRVLLRKTGAQVHLDIETEAGVESLTLDDTLSTYSALHAAKDGIAALVSATVDRVINALESETLPLPSALDGRFLVLASEAAAVLDGKQVATPVAQVEPSVDEAHALALEEDARDHGDDDDDEPPTKTEVPAAKRGKKAKGA